ncbi:MAG: 1,4-alpha-glucan branching protein GlgB [Chloroflexi bacterium]|nr:MAG: 1,4-alpha-glucan branching protein GlgB [Chloroflexota bacterium]
MTTSLLTADDLHYFNEGTHAHLHQKMGAHIQDNPKQPGTSFAVWAPDARSVSVIGDFNRWDTSANPLSPREQSGIWEGFVPAVGRGAVYKYRVRSRVRNYQADKADPFAFFAEVPPKTASVIWDLAYEWHDQDWMTGRAKPNGREVPWAVYEMHLGSWRRVLEEENRWLTYRELAPLLAAYVKRMGFTHVELLPVMEHPLYGSWGYQTTGYFAPTSRYGTPQDFMFLVDHLHQNGIGVILDWVPSHFPTDEHGLQYFDGTHLFEHADPRLGLHPDWGSSIFNYGRNEVRSFLLSSALFWLDNYHVDGLRVDAVASMLYLDYSRKPGEWIPNKFGGRENLDAVEFLRQLNTAAYGEHGDIQTVAEESTAWPMVSKPTYLGGLGFGMKWDMGWMHDTLHYMSQDPVYRKFHHNNLTFRMLYAFSESYMLPLSHDEVVHGKGSLLGKMPGDTWQKFANLRLLFAYMYAQPGKKLLFMGDEFGQWREWNHDASLDWSLLELPFHDGVSRWVADLNRVYREQKAMHELDFDPAGFRWIDANDTEQSVISLIRQGRTPDQPVLGAFNFTPVPRYNYLLGAPLGGTWKEILNSDAGVYGGSGLGNFGEVRAAPISRHGYPHALTLTLPPLGAIFLKPASRRAKA